MDIDFRWGGDPSIILGVEAAMVASIPIQVGVRFYRRFISCCIMYFFLFFCPSFAFGVISFKRLLIWMLPWCPILQLKDLQVFTVIRVIFQLAEEIPCISAVVVALLSEVHLKQL